MSRTVVLAAREGILHIADQTLTALDALSQARATEGREALQQFAEAAIGAWTGAASEAAIGAWTGAASEAATIVREGLGQIGTAVVGATLDVPDGDVREVMTNMESAISSLAVAIRAEEELLTTTLNGINDLMHGTDRLDLPPGLADLGEERGFEGVLRHRLG